MAGILSTMDIPRDESRPAMPDLLPTNPEYLAKLLHSQSRHLRLASMAAVEIRGVWSRVQQDLARQMNLQGVISIGEGDIVSETQAANRSLRAQVESLQQQLLQSTASMQRVQVLGRQLHALIESSHASVSGGGEPVKPDDLAQMSMLVSSIVTASATGNGATAGS